MLKFLAKRWLVLIIFGLLAVSIGANWVLFSAARGYYLDLQATRFNPLSLNAYPGDPPPKNENLRIVFYGDSRAFQWPSPEIDGIEFFNRGIGAQTSNQVLLRYDQHVAPLQPDIIIVQMCINELKTVPIFPERRKAILATCRQNSQTIIENARPAGATVILTTVFPVGEVPLKRRPFWSADVAVAVAEINDFLRQQAADDVLIFDAYAILEGEPNLINPDYAFDELHLNSAGYAALNAELVELLKSQK